MKGCSPFFRSTKKRGHTKRSRKSRNRKNKSMKGGCAGMCPMTHSMIGGYLRKRGSVSIANEKQKQKRNQNRNQNNNGDEKDKMKKSDSSSHSKHSHSRTPSSQMGGGLTLIPQDVTNMFRSFGYTAGSVYNSSGGYSAPVNPAPYADQFKSSFGVI
jgi:hypothetical protein